MNAAPVILPAVPRKNTRTGTALQSIAADEVFAAGLLRACRMATATMREIEAKKQAETKHDE